MARDTKEKIVFESIKKFCGKQIEIHFWIFIFLLGTIVAATASNLVTIRNINSTEDSYQAAIATQQETIQSYKEAFERLEIAPRASEDSSDEVSETESLLDDLNDKRRVKELWVGPSDGNLQAHVQYLAEEWAGLQVQLTYYGPTSAAALEETHKVGANAYRLSQVVGGVARDLYHHDYEGEGVLDASELVWDHVFTFRQLVEGIHSSKNHTLGQLQDLNARLVLMINRLESLEIPVS